MTQNVSDSQQSDDAIPSDPADYRRQRELVSRARRGWAQDESPDAAAFLAEHSAVSRYPSLAVELALEEYWIRRERGEQIDAAEFCDKFPSIRPSLVKCIECDEYARRELPFSVSPDDLPYPRPGDLLFNCRVEEEIGRGGFSRVYLCSQDDLGGRHTVVKVTDQALPEAETLGRLNHPNIITAHDVSEDPKLRLSCIRMPFVGRSTLRDLIQMAFHNGQLPRQATLIFEAAPANPTRRSLSDDRACSAHSCQCFLRHRCRPVVCPDRRSSTSCTSTRCAARRCQTVEYRVVHRGHTAVG